MSNLFDRSSDDKMAGLAGTFSRASQADAIQSSGWALTNTTDTPSSTGRDGGATWTENSAKNGAPALDALNTTGGGDVRAGGDIITNSRTVRYGGNGGEPGAKVQVFLDGKPVGTVTVGADGTWSVAFTVSHDGEFKLAFQQTDPAGNTSPMSDPIRLIVDTVPPEVTIDSVNGKVLAGTTEAGAEVTLRFSDGTPDRTVKVDESGRWTVSDLSLANGVKVTAIATDKAGNVSKPVEATVDGAAPEQPEITGVQEDTGTSTSDGITHDSTPVLHGKGEAGGRIDIYQDGAFVGSTNVGSDGTWRYDFGGKEVADGTYTFTAKQADAAGNESDPSAAFKVTVDTVAPKTPEITLASDSGTQGDWVTDDNTPTLDFTNLDDAIRLYVRVDGGEYLKLDVGNGKVSETLSHLADGRHTIEYYAEDRAGNFSEAEKKDLNIVPELQVNFENSMRWLYNGFSAYHILPIWRANGNPIRRYSGSWYEYERSGSSEEIDFRFTSTNKISDVDIILNGAKLDEDQTWNWIQFKEIEDGSYSISAMFRFLKKGPNDFKIRLTDEYGNEAYSKTIAFRTDPLALDLDGDGVVDTVSIDSGVGFDLDGDGRKDVTSWVGKTDGLLAYDRNGNGKIDDGTELFGPDMRMSNGEIADTPFQLLTEFDDNHDGIIDARDAGYDALAVWQDLNQDGITDPGELHALRDLGIMSIGINPDNHRETDSNNVDHVGRSEVKYTDGSSNVMEGLIFDSAQDSLEGWVFEYSHSANGDAVAKVIKTGVELHMSGFQVAAMPDLDILDTTGYGANRIVLDKAVLARLTDADNTLRIDADAKDTIEADGAALTEAGVHIGDALYNAYAFGDTTFLVSQGTHVVA